ncbi:MBL fold metallo-hydrolase [Iodidimonas muriae]|uniref:MBL fold metallo-hydrolase n=1 Tax=Iodidimonas muriae TaxID=261467 RepID=A0ABQ2LF58_9PROT|nr:MBL fold metallo-hydrolase [Iodidimonas muriae]GER07211.1 MBL fold metallo-hydrolase [Kordiimonadales bacterium JCM 17843]GGO11483.1 MBL fold metallo-hydrolase [Iodidimonas muriae]
MSPQMKPLGKIDLRIGVLVRVSPLIRRIVAPNSGPFTYTGTGTYVIGRGTVAVIDPGPADPTHVEKILDGLGSERVSHIVITHTHRDHSPGASLLQDETGAPVLAYGPHGAGARADLPSDLAMGQVEEGADMAFRPDELLRDGDHVRGPGWSLEAIWTPGHTSNHLCFALAAERALFSGDHVMGWSTSVISPPDGDMGQYMASLERVGARDDAVFWPTHGPPIPKPARHVAALIAHRKGREQAILACLEAGICDVPDIVARLYTDLHPGLIPAAARSVLAHLVDLADRDMVGVEGPFNAEGRFFITSPTAHS